jgi:putative membrane protein
MRLDNILTWLHVTGNLIWIGAILAVGLVLLSPQGDAKVRGELGKRIYLYAATPGFLVSFLFGMGRLLMDPKHYFVETHWMHGKLLFALIFIGLHHVIGARAKKMASGAVADAGPTRGLLIGMLVCAVGATFFALVMSATGM